MTKPTEAVNAMCPKCGEHLYLLHLEWVKAKDAEIARLRERLEKVLPLLGRKQEALELALARCSRLEAVAGWALPEACAMLCPSVGKAGVPIPHLPECESAAAALKEARR